jgi:hypothetical protein
MIGRSGFDLINARLAELECSVFGEKTSLSSTIPASTGGYFCLFLDMAKEFMRK